LAGASRSAKGISSHLPAAPFQHGVWRHTGGPFGGTDETLKDLKAKVFKDREIKFRALEGDKSVARLA